MRKFLAGGLRRDFQGLRFRGKSFGLDVRVEVLGKLGLKLKPKFLGLTTFLIEALCLRHQKPLHRWIKPQLVARKPYTVTRRVSS